jgi:hypothetical protein
MRASIDQRGEAEALWCALLDVLGQGGDREGFRRLADRLTWRRAATTGDALAAMLLWVAGLGPPSSPPTAAHPDALQETEALEHLVPLRPGLAVTGRPANHPGRRLRGLAALTGRARGDLVAYARHTVATAIRPKTLVAAWQAGCPPGPALIGPGRARELVLNAVLPFTAVSPSLQDASRALLAQLPPGLAYGKTRFLESNLNAVDGRRLAKSALHQQGLLAFLQEWCSRRLRPLSAFAPAALALKQKFYRPGAASNLGAENCCVFDSVQRPRCSRDRPRNAFEPAACRGGQCIAVRLPRPDRLH